MRLLVAEDDQALGAFLSRGLEADGHDVRWVGDGLAALYAFEEESPDLTILDLNLPRKDGEEVLQHLRGSNQQLPILILTARPDQETRIRCLNRGADDYMLKPFSLMELRARCRALLRRRGGSPLILRCGELELDRITHTVRRGGQEVALTNKEFALLDCLLTHRGRCVSRTALLEEVWNGETAAGTNVVDVYVNYLRKKLNDNSQDSLIRTVRGKGYCVAFPTVQTSDGDVVRTG